MNDYNFIKYPIFSIRLYTHEEMKLLYKILKEYYKEVEADRSNNVYSIFKALHEQVKNKRYGNEA